MHNTLLRRLSASLVLALLVFAGSMAAEEAPAATKEQKVRELLVLMRAGDLGMQTVDAMIDAMKDAIQAPDEYWTSFRQKIKADDLVDMLVPVYAKHLDSADIDELIRFYRSPAGQRFLDKQPAILQESMVIGQKWGEQLAMRAIEDLNKK